MGMGSPMTCKPESFIAYCLPLFSLVVILFDAGMTVPELAISLGYGWEASIYCQYFEPNPPLILN